MYSLLLFYAHFTSIFTYMQESYLKIVKVTPIVEFLCEHVLITANPYLADRPTLG